MRNTLGRSGVVDPEPEDLEAVAQFGRRLWLLEHGEILYEGRDYVPMNQTAVFQALSRVGRRMRRLRRESAPTNGAQAKSMEEGPERNAILARVGIYLGYCFLDGDAGQKEDNEKAIEWFRLAAAHGNEGAQRVSGWTFNTRLCGVV